MAVGVPPIVGVNPSHTVSSIPAFTTGRAVTVIFTVSDSAQIFMSVTKTTNWVIPGANGVNVGLGMVASSNSPGGSQA